MAEIRPLKSEEVPLLEEFLYQAIFIPQGLAPLSRSILKEPDLEMYIKDFGQQPDDWALAAEVDGLLVGVVWVRIMKDCGYYDDQTPSLSISFLPDFKRARTRRAVDDGHAGLAQGQRLPKCLLIRFQRQSRCSLLSKTGLCYG